MRHLVTACLLLTLASASAHAQEKPKISEDVSKALDKRLERVVWYGSTPWGEIAWQQGPFGLKDLFPVVHGSAAFPPPGTPDLGVPFGFQLALPAFEQFRFESRMVLGMKNLRYLVLSGYRYDGADLKQLAKVPALKMIQMENASDQVIDILKSVETLEHLNFRVQNKLTAKGVRTLAEYKNLRWLKLPLGEFAAEDYKEFAQMKKLTHLDLSYSNLSNPIARHLKELPELTELNLAANPRLTPDIWKELKTLKKLRALDLSQLKDVNTTLKELKGMKHLRSLRINLYTDAQTLVMLSDFTQLEHLDVRGCPMGAELEALKKALPKCKILP